MNDQRFFDLAMKVIAGHATDAERAELDALLVREPELKTEFARLQAEVRFMREVLPLVNATEATTGEFPAYARERLQTMVRQTLGRPATSGESKSHQLEPRFLRERFPGMAGRKADYAMTKGKDRAKERSAIWSRLLRFFCVTSGPVIQVGILAGACANLEAPLMPSKASVRQYPMTKGKERARVGALGGASGDYVQIIKQTWPDASVLLFATAKDLKDWGNEGVKKTTVKIIYGQPAGEIRVLGEWNGKTLDKTFLIERDLSTTLKLVKNYLDHFIAA